MCIRFFCFQGLQAAVIICSWSTFSIRRSSDRRLCLRRQSVSLQKQVFVASWQKQISSSSSSSCTRVFLASLFWLFERRVEIVAIERGGHAMNAYAFWPTILYARTAQQYCYCYCYWLGVVWHVLFVCLCESKFMFLFFLQIIISANYFVFCEFMSCREKKVF